MMNLKFLRVFSLFFTILLVTTGYSHARTFTDRAGNQFEASIVSMTDTTVNLMVPSKGKILKVPIAKLSATDQDYLKAHKNNQLTTKTKPAPAEPAVKPAETTEKADPTANKEDKPKRLGPSSAELKAKHRLVDNYLTGWPKSVSASRNQNVKIISENKAAERFIYHSTNYEFISDVKLSSSIVKNFAVMFEATREYCRKLPISSMKAHVHGNESRNRILLFGNMRNYIRNGGHPQAAGLFRSDTNDVLIPLTSLGVIKAAAGYTYDYSETNVVITHELVHQLTDLEYYNPGSRGWFSEGLAEYCAATPYLAGQYVTRSNLNNIREYVTAYGKGGRSLGKNILAPDLKRYMLQPYSSFASNGNYNYGLGTLITYYFFHMEADRRNIISFMKALKQGKKGEDALQALLNGRSFDQLENDIEKAWSAKGVKISFR